MAVTIALAVALALFPSAVKLLATLAEFLHRQVEKNDRLKDYYHKLS